MVKIQDRVVLTGAFDTTISALKPILKSLNVSQAQFFANAVNTTNYGIDVVVDYTKKWGNQSVKVLFAGNLQKMAIDKINVPTALNDNETQRLTFLSKREQNFILASAPPAKFSLGVDYTCKKVGFGIRFTYFGKIDLIGYGDGTPSDFTPEFTNGNLLGYIPSDADGSAVRDQYIYKPKVTTDVYTSYNVSSFAKISLGVDNLFNVHPDIGNVKAAKSFSFNGETGGPWDAVQMGFNGMRLFSKISFNF
jgi:iron complex outermembrane receptor protein